jgi:hypothetical protein
MNTTVLLFYDTHTYTHTRADILALIYVISQINNTAIEI